MKAVRWIVVVTLGVLLGGCKSTMDGSLRTSPATEPAGPPAATAPRRESVTVALLPTITAGVSPEAGPAWHAAFRQALERDPRVRLADPKEVDKTVKDHAKGKFNAFKHVTADVWIESWVQASDQAAKNTVTGKIQTVQQVGFKALFRKNLDDRQGFETFRESGKLLPTEKMAAQHKEVDTDLVSRVAANVLEALVRLP